MSNVNLTYYLSIHKRGTTLATQIAKSAIAPSQIQAQEKAIEDARAILEEHVIDSGQISNYNGMFALLNHTDQTTWLILEYRPCFQYLTHTTKKTIGMFADKLGVQIG